ncbi:MAG: glucuronate isomerase [Bacteroidales bacterium]|nr:glucuronate isomerase [Bacteroidales bacterium]
MKKFLDENFVLQTETAQKLYHEHAKNLPIIDYHCHLPPHEIAEDKKFKTLTNIWLDGDHYKWRAMRANGVDEKYCTGDAPEFEKFMKWAETVPQTLRNPLYHWTHLELKGYFGIDKVLNPKTAREIYDECTEKLNTDAFSTRNLMRKMNVEVVCTTDDPVDSLEHHKKIKKDGFEIKVLPTWRPDKAMAVEMPETYNEYVDKLAEVSDIHINSYHKLLEALRKRHDFFGKMGCKLSDHGIENFYAEDYSESEIENIFDKIRLGHMLSLDEILLFKSAMLYELAVMDYEKDWTQQFHIGAIRNNNSKMFMGLGPDKGYDAIIDLEVARPMSNFLDRLESESKLAKTICYNLNPRDNELFVTMLYSFNDGSIPGKMQFGSGWWFLDQKDGMQKQMNALSVLGLLSRFVGMLTDSRSFLSYPRHEYFRRVLCDLLGTDVENGEIPNDMELVGKMVENISYYNAKNYFKF